NPSISSSSVISALVPLSGTPSQPEYCIRSILSASRFSSFLVGLKARYSISRRTMHIPVTIRILPIFPFNFEDISAFPISPFSLSATYAIRSSGPRFHPKQIVYKLLSCPPGHAAVVQLPAVGFQKELFFVHLYAVSLCQLTDDLLEFFLGRFSKIYGDT